MFHIGQKRDMFSLLGLMVNDTYIPTQKFVLMRISIPCNIIKN